MRILKFGGTSVGNYERINSVVEIVTGFVKRKERLVVVCSAFSGITDLLATTAKKAALNDDSYLNSFKELKSLHLYTLRKLIPGKQGSEANEKLKLFLGNLQDLLTGIFSLNELTLQSLDLVMSFGEYLSCFIISETFKVRGIECELLDTRAVIKTNNNFGNAKVNFELSYNLIKKYFSTHRKLQIATGFISSTEGGESTTLGRGGSDYTASILGAALDAVEIEIWTDVDGIMTADPRKVQDAYSLKAVTYEEAMEMSHFGAKVIYPPTMLPALQKKIKIRIKNTFNPAFKGTVILEREKQIKFNMKGVSSIDDIHLLQVEGSGLISIEGISSRIFDALVKAKVNVMLITQGSSGHTICIAVIPSKSVIAKKAIEDELKFEILGKQIKRVEIIENLSLLAVVGEDMLETPGIFGKVFSALGRNGISVMAIAQGSSQLNISLVIKKSALKKALNVLHEALFLSPQKTLNLFIIGPGKIGSNFLKYIEKQNRHMFSEMSIRLKLVGVGDSKRMLFAEEGIPLKDWEKVIETSGIKMNIKTFINIMQSLNLANSIFLDCTAGQKIIPFYKDILSSAISVVTPNKLANSGTYEQYIYLKTIAKKFGVDFRYSANVGVGLPTIDVLDNLKDSGDEIYGIEGLFSSTLNYILQEFVTRNVKFSDLLLEAIEMGYTESDPREDLSGRDAARKLLILARESRVKLEMEDIKVESLLPESLMKTKNIDSFFTKLKMLDKGFEERKRKALLQGKVLRYISKYEKGHAVVKLSEVGAEHPFYNITAKEKIIAISTKFYSNTPFIMKGYGGGAETAAAVILSDILKISKYGG
jgi:aspartokinase/homoserine dehydrogenase 1